jgi:transposase
MSIVADHYRTIVGVDTHAATHTYAVVESPSGKLLDQKTFPTTPAGLSRATVWISRRADGNAETVLISAEGTGSYGAVMARRLTEAGYRVVEAPMPSAKRLRGKGKTDSLDAITAARSTLIMDIERLRDRRAGEVQTVLKLLTVGREQMNADRLRALNALTALIRATTSASTLAMPSLRRRSSRSPPGGTGTNPSVRPSPAAKPSARPNGSSPSAPTSKPTDCSSPTSSTNTLQPSSRCRVSEPSPQR